ITALAAGFSDLIASQGNVSASVHVRVEARSRFESVRRCCFWDFLDSSDPHTPVQTLGRCAPQPADNRPQTTIDENFSVPAGTQVIWDNQIVWVRPKQR